MRTRAGPYVGVRPVVGVAISLALHAVVFTLASTPGVKPVGRPDPLVREQTVTVLVLRPPVQARPAPARERPSRAAAARPAPRPSTPAPQAGPVVEPATPPQPASMAAPPAPTAEEWAFAGKYTLKNSKGYRYTWGQQVRSMMGTAIEGPEQGVVRFRVEIAPDGTLARLETLWTTSPVAERLARQAIGSMPQWPPTPTGRPLIFEKTISFTPHASDGPPLYRDDCLPDPPVFINPFAWDGASARRQVPAPPPEKPDPRTLDDCLQQLPQDSIEAESARDRRLMEQWGSSKAGR